MNVAMENGEIVVTRPDESNLNKSLHGLTRTPVSYTHLRPVITEETMTGIAEKKYAFRVAKTATKPEIRACLLYTSRCV